MKKLVEKVKKAIPLLIEDYTAEDTGSFDFVQHRNEIMKELDFCQKKGSLVGVYSRKMGQGLFLVGVQEIIYGIKSEFIIFYPFDMGGYKLTTNAVSLEDIEKIIPFNNRFVMPDFSISRELASIRKYMANRPGRRV
jgi:hypothetical protein